MVRSANTWEIYKIPFLLVFLNIWVFGGGSFLKGSSSFFTGNNSLWDDLYTKCGNRVLFHCVQDRLITYINNTLDSELRITDGIHFVKSAHVNEIVDSKHTREGRSEPAVENLPRIVSNEIGNSTQHEDEEGNEFSSFVKTVEKLEDEMVTVKSRQHEVMNNATVPEDEVREPRTDNFVIRNLNQVTDILYDKIATYLSTHDLRLDLPSFVYGRSRMIISPRGFDEDGGILLKLNFSPVASGRTDLGHRFPKMFKKKMLTHFLLLLLIIKLIKIKLVYVLPIIIGANAAKKLLLKVLLFLFPPMVHLFKLCAYYHAHAQKVHYHHYKVKHHHHRIPVPVPHPVHTPYVRPDGAIDELPFVGPSIVSDHDHNLYEPLPPSYSAPAALPTDYYTRYDMTDQHAHKLPNWGLKHYHTNTELPGVLSANAQAYSPYAEYSYTNSHGPYGSKLYTGSSKKNKVSVTRSRPWKSKSENHRNSEGNSAKSGTMFASNDPFYSPILQKIDSIFHGLGFKEEGCRQRLVCSMYRNPLRFSPHSNLLSTELSRDPDELQKPSQTNLAAIRFYKYVEAARNGQAQADCLSSYPDCVVKTE